MGFKERIERIRQEEREKRARERGAELAKEAERDRILGLKEKQLRDVLEGWQVPEIVSELNEECLDGKGWLHYDKFRGDSLFLRLEWDDEEGDRDYYIYASIRKFKVGSLFSKEKTELYIYGVGFINFFDRDSLEEAFAKAFLHHGSEKKDRRDWDEKNR